MIEIYDPIEEQWILNSGSQGGQTYLAMVISFFNACLFLIISELEHRHLIKVPHFSYWFLLPH